MMKTRFMPRCNDCHGFIKNRGGNAKYCLDCAQIRMDQNRLYCNLRVRMAIQSERKHKQQERLRTKQMLSERKAIILKTLRLERKKANPNWNRVEEAKMMLNLVSKKIKGVR